MPVRLEVDTCVCVVMKQCKISMCFLLRCIGKQTRVMHTRNNPRNSRQRTEVILLRLVVHELDARLGPRHRHVLQLQVACGCLCLVVVVGGGVGCGGAPTRSTNRLDGHDQAKVLCEAYARVEAPLA